MNGMGSTPPTIFSTLQPIGIVFFVLIGRVIAALAIRTR